MLTSREFTQLGIAIVGAGGHTVNGEPMVPLGTVLSLIQSFTEGNAVIERDGPTYIFKTTAAKPTPEAPAGVPNNKEK